MMAGRPKGISWGKAGGDAKEEVALVMKRGAIFSEGDSLPWPPHPHPGPKAEPARLWL